MRQYSIRQHYAAVVYNNSRPPHRVKRLRNKKKCLPLFFPRMQNSQQEEREGIGLSFLLADRPSQTGPSQVLHYPSEIEHTDMPSECRLYFFVNCVAVPDLVGSGYFCRIRIRPSNSRIQGYFCHVHKSNNFQQLLQIFCFFVNRSPGLMYNE